jgi:hypothetical protein
MKLSATTNGSTQVLNQDYLVWEKKDFRKKKSNLVGFLSLTVFVKPNALQHIAIKHRFLIKNTRGGQNMSGLAGALHNLMLLSTVAT